LKWRDQLQDDEVELLDLIGRQFKYLVTNPESTLSPTLSRAILAAWQEHPEKYGLYRILAVAVSGEFFDDSQNPEPPPAKDVRFAAPAALLDVKLTDEPDQESLTALAEAPELWLKRGISTIAEQASPANGARSIKALDLLLGPEQWEQKRELGDVAVELIGRRPSPLTDEEGWAELMLFARPAPT